MAGSLSRCGVVLQNGKGVRPFARVQRQQPELARLVVPAKKGGRQPQVDLDDPIVMPTNGDQLGCVTLAAPDLASEAPQGRADAE